MSGTSTTQTRTGVKPYKNSIPLINTALQDAMRAYEQGGQVDTTSHVVPMSKQTQQSYDGIMKNATQNAYGPNGITSQMRNIIGNGGFNNRQNNAMNNMSSQLNQLGKNGLSSDQDRAMNVYGNQLNQLGSNGLSNAQDGAMRSLAGQSRRLGNNGLSSDQDRSMNVYNNQLNQIGSNGLTNSQDRVLQNYSQLANSSYNANANPGAQGVLNSAIRDTKNAVNLNASAAGRYGSGTHEGVLASKVGDLSSDFRYNDYNNWLGRRDTANNNVASLSQQGLGNRQGIAQQMSSLGQQGIGNTQGLAQGIASLGQQGIQNRQGLAQGMSSLGQQGVGNRQGLSSGLFNAAQAGIGNMNTAYQGSMQPFQSMAGVGSAYDDLATRTMNDRLRITNETQNAPWQNIGNLLNVANLGGQYNNTTSTTTAPGPNPFLQTVGGVTSGLSGLNNLFSMF